MKEIKKIICLILSVCFIVSLFSGCGGKTEQNKDKLKIVTTIFPCFDFAREVTGKGNKSVDIKMLLDNGVDLHSFQPTAKDIVDISQSDLFIYIGGESDEWVEDLLKDPKNKNLKALNLMDALGDSSLRTEETVEGMQDEEDNENESKEEYDEHIWLSLKNSQIIVSEIEKKISEINPQNSDKYKSNTENYIKKLQELETKYKETVNNSSVKTLLFADRFPFRYLTDDLGLKYYAAFKGCSAESEASFETISFLAGKIKELNLNSVAVLDGSTSKIAQTVIKTSKKQSIKTVTFNSMQTITSKDVENGDTYLSISENNLNALKEALK